MSGKIKVNFVKTLWGVTPELGNQPSGYQDLFKRIKSEGFDGVETPISVIADKKLFCQALKDNGLFYVAMINTCTFSPDPISTKLDDHLASFERLVKEAKETGCVLINSHSGRDAWSRETTRAFFKIALEIEEREGIKICHETHRGRILYNPWTTRDLLNEFPNLKLTADLSHFCVVAERVFDPASGVDDDWEEILNLVASRAHHVHARVGYAQGPQVPDPAAPEYESALIQHEIWWDRILTKQAAQGNPSICVEPEHGTNHYQHLLPYTMMPVGDLWVINNWIKDREKARMSKLHYWKDE